MRPEMKTGRTGNVKRNLIYGFLQVIVAHVLPFVVRTVMIYRFGVEYVGLNSLFASVLSVLSLMELGFGTAVVYSMYRPAAEGDVPQLCALLSYYRRIYRIIGLAILGAGLLIMPFLKALVRDPVLPGGLNLYVCYLIFLLNAVISYLLFGYLTAIPVAYQRRDILSRVNMGMSVLTCAIQVLLLLGSNNFDLYLLSVPAFTVIKNLLIAAVVRRRYPGLVCRGEIRPEQKRGLKRKVSGILVNKLTNVSRNSIDSLCISAFLGLAVTGMYNNYYIVMSTVLSCGIMVCSSMLASVGNSIAVESREKNYADLRLFDFLFMAAVGWAAVCLLCLMQPFIVSWVGDRMTFGFPVVLGFGVYYYILESGAIQWTYHEGAGLWYECRYIMFGEAAANVILNILLCRIWGVFGIILATVLSVFFTNCILCPSLLFRVYFRNGKQREYWTDHIQYAGTTVLTACASWLVCENALPMRMLNGREVSACALCLGGRLLVCTVLAAGIFWLLWHRSERYSKALAWLKRL